MTIAVAEIRVGHVIHELEKMPAGSIHSCMTSPPYWGLRDYKLEPQDWGGWTGHLGLEPTIDLYIAHMLQVFEGVRRVLRDDGLLFVNLGDSYARRSQNCSDRGGASGNAGIHAGVMGSTAYLDRPIPDGLKPADLCNVPHRFALAMQAAGWYLRSTIVWAKGVSFCDSYSGSVMPESLAGTRWERCRVKEAGTSEDRWSNRTGGVIGWNQDTHPETRTPAEFFPCPGCDKCTPNDGWVLRRGSWRPTSAFEYVFMFAKSSSYWCDGDAVREKHAAPEEQGTRPNKYTGRTMERGNRWSPDVREYNPAGRNLRNCWLINPQPFPLAHFATFPEALVEPLIKCSTSDKGVCPECGGQWARCVEDRGYTKHRPSAGDDPRSRNEDKQAEGSLGGHHGWRGNNLLKNAPATVDWRPTCTCDTGSIIGPEYDAVPAVVLDPFAGSGTTLLVARKLGRHSIGIELNPEYAEMARKRLGDYAPLFTGADE